MRLKKKKLEILVDWDFNASAISRPAFGIIGPSTHYIRFGLPLLADQLRTVLAHELAHLSRNHSGFGTRIVSSIYPRANYTFLPSSLRFGDGSEIA